MTRAQRANLLRVWAWLITIHRHVAPDYTWPAASYRFVKTQAVARGPLYPRVEWRELR